MDITGSASNQISNVVQDPGDDLVAPTTMLAAWTGVMFVIAATFNNLGLRQILWTGNAFRGIRQIFSGARHGKVLLDLLFLAWNLTLLPSFVMAVFPAMMLKSPLKSYLILMRLAPGSLQEAQEFDDWLESYRFKHPGGSEVMAIEMFTKYGAPTATAKLLGAGEVMWWEIREPGYRFACVFSSLSQYKVPHDAADVPNIGGIKDESADLMSVARRGDTDTVKALLAANADVNTKDKYGQTALMYAAKEGHTDIVKVLLAAGADVNARDDNGETALMLAERKSHQDIFQLLIDAGAKE